MQRELQEDGEQYVEIEDVSKRALSRQFLHGLKIPLAVSKIDEAQDAKYLRA